MPNERPMDVGPWSGDDFAATVRPWAGIGTDDDLPQPIRFVAGVARLIRRRLQVPGASGDLKRPAVFLLQPVPPPSVNPSPRVPMLDNGLTPLNDRLWFVNEMAVTGKFVELAEANDEVVFAMITNDLALGGSPAVVLETRTPEVEARFYPNGLGQPDLYLPVRLDASPITLDAVFDSISRVHKQCLVTPEAQIHPAKLWEDKDKWWPSQNAEALIQVNLKAGFVTAFPTCVIRHEQPSPAGRLDILIEEQDFATPGSVVRYAVLELKVLRSFGETGRAYRAEDIDDWIRSGVTQAASYRTDRNALAAALCCFDMRKTFTGPSCFQHVTDLASGAAVRLGHWHLFASSEHYRQHPSD